MSIKVLGLPYDLNSSFLRGAALAPPRIRLMESDGSANTFAELGQDIRSGQAFEDLGDLDIMADRPEAAFAKIRARVAEIIANGNKLVSLGGDHSVAYPVLDAYLEQYPGLHILQIDAHGDLYDDFDGNPYSHASPFARLMETGKAGSLTQVGNRSLNTHQREQAARFGVKIIEMHQFSFDFLNHLQGPLYVSVDLDGLDPAFAPGVSHHEPGGLSTRELFYILQNIEVPIVGGDVVEYNPIRDYQNMTAMVAYKTMKELMAKML
ncbi:MAG TPA: agmatinase [Saprospiraceae bacterium]|nr:agmatinase [Saprospiraceae bacterium]